MPTFIPDPNLGMPLVRQFYEALAAQIDKGPVSYTHLTLPTKA